MDGIDVHFDFTCRFAYRLHRWLDQLQGDVTWQPFSLLEAKRDDGGTRVWDRPEHAENISLLMLAGHEVVREADSDTGGYRSRMFAAWHDTDERLDAQSVLDNLHRSGVDADRADLDFGRKIVGQRHIAAVQRGVFGSSTIVYPSSRGSFVRFSDVPGVEHADQILTALATLAERAPELQHYEPLHP